jgi:hypothetical protein
MKNEWGRIITDHVISFKILCANLFQVKTLRSSIQINELSSILFIREQGSVS